MLAHLAGNMGQHFVAVGKGHTKHGPGEHLSHRTREFDRFFFRHKTSLNCLIAEGPGLPEVDPLGFSTKMVRTGKATAGIWT